MGWGGDLQLWLVPGCDAGHEVSPARVIAIDTDEQDALTNEVLD